MECDTVSGTKSGKQMFKYDKLKDGMLSGSRTNATHWKKKENGEQKKKRTSQRYGSMVGWLVGWYMHCIYVHV